VNRVFVGLILLSNLSWAQCELSLLDTLHVKCNGQNSGGFTLSTNSTSSFDVFLSNGVVQTDNLVFSNLPASIYTAVIVDDLACTDSIVVKVKEPSLFEVDIKCENDLVVANSSGGVLDYVCEWRSDDGSIISQSDAVAFSPGYLYDLRVLDGNLCEFRDSVFVLADFEIGNSLGEIPYSVTVDNLSSQGVYSWNFGDEFSSADFSPSHTFLKVGMYTVSLNVLDDFGCEHQKEVLVDVQGFDFQLDDWKELPNVFSPNNDGLNDFFSFENSHAINEFSVQIFNRWGDLVYYWKDPNLKWDGKNKSGQNLSEGVYFYNLKAVGQNGKLYQKKGSITMFL